MEKVSREIDLGDGSGKQVFEAEGATLAEAYEALSNSLAEAQVNATRKIAEQDAEVKTLRRRVLTQPEGGEQDPEGPAAEFKPRELTADEEFQLSKDLQNPATSRAARRRMLEIELGAPLETVRQTLRRADRTPRELRAREAAEAFMNAHSEYLPTAQNSQLMFELMTKRGMPLTEKNFEIAYGELSAAGLLQLGTPRDSGGAPGNTNGGGAGGADSPNGRRASTPRFASTSTSTVTRTSGSPRGGASGAKMPTAEEIEAMSASQHKKWLQTPGFMEHEERVLKQRAAGRR